MNQETQIKADLKNWIVQCKSGLTVEQIQDETPLIAQKYISSVQVLDLILFVESLGAKDLDPSKLTPQSFQTVNSIYQNFFV